MTVLTPHFHLWLLLKRRLGKRSEWKMARRNDGKLRRFRVQSGLGGRSLQRMIWQLRHLEKSSWWTDKSLQHLLLYVNWRKLRLVHELVSVKERQVMFHQVWKNMTESRCSSKSSFLETYQLPSLPRQRLTVLSRVALAVRLFRATTSTRPRMRM